MHSRKRHAVAKPIVTQITDAFFKWLSLPNYDTVEIVAATVIANRLPGEPLWLALVGPSSSGKTEIVRALDGMERVHCVDKIGPATWVSGFRPSDAALKREKVRPNGGGGKQALPMYGLLGQMMDGQPHIVVVEDFSSVLSIRKEIKGEVFAGLRKLYDGKYHATFGNGQSIDWAGKVGMIVCSTGQYDQQVTEIASFGERFCVWRAHPGHAVQVAERAGRNSERSAQMRGELATAMSRLDNVKLPTGSVPLSLDARTLVSRLTAFVALCRTPVPRDPFRRDIITVPEPEGTGRLSAQLHQLMRGLVVLYGHKEVTSREVALVQECAFSTIPSLRRALMRAIDPAHGTTRNDLIKRSRMPKVVMHRVLEEMLLLGLIKLVEPTRRVLYSTYKPTEEWKPFFYYLQTARSAPSEEEPK